MATNAEIGNPGISATDHQNNRNFWDKLMSSLKEMKRTYPIKFNCEFI